MIKVHIKHLAAEQLKYLAYKEKQKTKEEARQEVRWLLRLFVNLRR